MTIKEFEKTSVEYWKEMKEPYAADPSSMINFNIYDSEVDDDCVDLNGTLYTIAEYEKLHAGYCISNNEKYELSMSIKMF